MERNYRYVIQELKSKHAVSGSGNSTLNQNRRPDDDDDDDDDDIPYGEGGVESDRQAARIGGEVVYDEDDRLDFVRQSKYAEYYAYIWLLFEKLDMLNSVESSLDTDTASTMTNTPRASTKKSTKSGDKRGKGGKGGTGGKGGGMSEGSKALLNLMKSKERRDRKEQKRERWNLQDSKIEEKKAQVSQFRLALADIIAKHTNIGLGLLGASLISKLDDSHPALDALQGQVDATKVALVEAEEELKELEEEKEKAGEIIFSSDDEDDVHGLDVDFDEGEEEHTENDPLEDIKYIIYRKVYRNRRNPLGVSADKLCLDYKYKDADIIKALEEMEERGEVVCDDMYTEDGKPRPLDEFYVIGTHQDQDELFGKDKEERDEFDDDAGITDMIDNDGNDGDEE